MKYSKLFISVVAAGVVFSVGAGQQIQANQKVPAKYDPRGTLLPIRDQTGSLLCWSYTTVDMLSIGKQKATGVQTEYSPNYYNYLTALNPATSYYGNIDNTYNLYLNVGDGGLLNENFGTRKLGGAGMVTQALTAAQLGYTPMTEADFPTLPGIDAITGKTATETEISDAEFAAIKTKGDKSLEVQDVYMPEVGTQAENVARDKQFILKYGSVDYLWSLNDVAGDLAIKNTTDDESSPYFNEKTGAYYIPADGICNNGHESLIVGWDDNYAKENFASQNQPEADGAFLVKNTFGTNFGENGYFWVSYADKNLFNTAMSGEAVKVTKPEADEIHSNAKASAPYTKTFNYEYDYQGALLVTNQFTVDQDQTLDALQLPVIADQEHLDVYLVKGAIDKDTTLNAQQITTQGKLLYSGQKQYRSKIKQHIKPQRVKAGETFTLVALETNTHSEELIQNGQRTAINDQIELAGQQLRTQMVASDLFKGSAMAYVDPATNDLTWPYDGDKAQNYLNYYSKK